jgi:hypothetical protein
MSYSSTLPPSASLVVLWLLIGLVLLWPTRRPYVVQKGSERSERILIFRAPSYWARSWYIRWVPSDGLFARATCYDPEKSATYRDAMRTTP